MYSGVKVTGTVRVWLYHRYNRRPAFELLID